MSFAFGVRVRAILSLILLLLLAGCASGRRKDVLAGHPLGERAMSMQVAEGLTASGVWKIRGASNTVYLAGTSHLVAPDQTPFPSPFYAAYNDSQEIIVEYDTHSFMGQLRVVPKAVKWVMAHRAEFVCPRGRSIADYVSADTVAALKSRYGEKEFRKRRKFTPLYLLFMSEFEAVTENASAKSGVEDVFMVAARRDGKPLRALDDKQVIDTAMLALDEMLAALRVEIERRGVDAVIEDKIIHPKAEDPLDDLWRKGDLAGIEKFQEEMKEESPGFFQMGLVDRNRKWMPRIEAALRGKRNVMILVGCGHLAGDVGLLKLLRDAGYEARQLYGVDRPGGVGAR